MTKNALCFQMFHTESTKLLGIQSRGETGKHPCLPNENLSEDLVNLQLEPICPKLLSPDHHKTQNGPHRVGAAASEKCN